MISDDSFSILVVVQAVSVANAASDAAKEAVSLAVKIERLSLGDRDVEENRMMKRRRRQKKRKKTMEFYDDVYDYDNDLDCFGWCLVKGCTSRKERFKYLTRKQEAEFSVYLKVGAMVEDTDSRYGTTSGRVETRRMMGRSDKASLKARECRERITLSYKRLVVSIAAPYQGKGLSLEDLIQVDFILF